MCRELTGEDRSLTPKQLPPLSEAVGIEVGALAELQAQRCSGYDVGSYFSTLKVWDKQKPVGLHEGLVFSALQRLLVN